MDLNPDHTIFELDATVQDWDDDYYHPIAQKSYDRAIPWLLTAIGATPDALVLDAGCGPGVHAIRAANFGCKVDAIDISKTMLAHAHKRASAAGVAASITFARADLTKFRPKQQYDHVFSWGVLIHVPEVDAALENLAAAVAPGGSLGLSILSAGSADFMLERLVRRILFRPLKEKVETDLGTGNWYEMNGTRLWVIRFDIDALDARMQTLGFTRTARKTAEFSELQRRCKGALRSGLLALNNFVSRVDPLPALSATQMLVYTKDNDAP